MSLANEAAYLYVYAKKLLDVNKKLKRLHTKAQKHAQKHSRASTQEKKQKHQAKHQKATGKIKDRLEHKHEILKKLHRHQIAFAHQLQKEMR